MDKQSQLRPLVHNIAQLKVHNALEIQQAFGFPLRVIVLKARQEGISTYFAAKTFEDVNTKPNRHNNMTSMDTEGTDKIFEMIRTFQTELPADIKRKTRRSNKKELVYEAPHRSGILCQTAGKDVLGRGGTTNMVHATEIAFWRNAKKQLGGLLQEVPEEPDTLIALESTACGDSGEFHGRFWEAVKRMNRNRDAYDGFIPIFLPWWIFPEYQTPLPGYMNGHLDLISDDPYQEPQHDRFYRSKKIILTPEQWVWRRKIIESKCGMDLSLFKQEYPATAREAFQSTGWAVFSPVTLDRHEVNCREPSARVEFVEVDGKARVEHVLRYEDCWFVWKWPDKTHEYVVYGDVCEGLQSDKADPKSDPDYHACGVLDRTAQEVVATFHGRCDTINYGEQMYHGAKFYNWALATPEINSCGLAVLNELKRRNYPNIYSRMGGDEKLVEQETDNLGYRTTSLNRKPGIEQVKTSLNNDEIRIYDQRIIEELRAFAMVNGRPEAKVGYHDDWVMMLVGLLQVHLTGPMADEELPPMVAREKQRVPVANQTDDEADLDGEGLEDDGNEDDDDVWQ